MTEFVKPYKLESTASGGSQNDQITTEIDPINDSLPIASICLQRVGNAMDDAVRTYRDSSDNLVLVDKVTGSKTLAQLVATASGISALTGDVTASGSGSVTASVASVGGASASNVASAAALVAASRAANSVYAGPTSGAGAAAFRALVSADLPTIALAKLDTTGASTGYVPTYNGTSYVAAAVAALTALTGDVTASGNGSQAATVASVGGQTASAVAAAAALVVGSKTANYVLASPNGASGSSSFRALVAADIPTLPATQISGLATSATTNTTNANNITSGILAPAILSGSYTGITAVGTLTAGSVPTSLLTGNIALTQIATAGAVSGQFISYNGTSLVYATPAAGSTGTVANTPSTLPQRDTAGALFASPAIQVFSGAGNTHTTTINESGTTYYLDGGGTANALALTLGTLPSGQAGMASVCNTSAAGSTYTVSAASGGSIYYPGGSTTGTLTTAVPQSAITFLGRPGAANWVIQSLAGVWQNTASGNALGGVFTADLAYAGSATAANTAGALAMRDANGNFAAGTITAALAGNATSATSFTGSLAGDVTGTQAATVVAQVGGQTAAIVASAASLVSGSKTANFVLAAPNGSAGSAAFRALVAADVPTLPATQISGLATSATTDTTNAANIASGTLPAARLSGGYTGITAVGALTAGTIPTSLLSGIVASAQISGSYTGITAIGTLTAGVVPTTLLGGTITLAQITTSGASSGQVLAYNGTSLAYTTLATGITALTGDVTASGSGSVAATVASVGGSTASNVNAATSLVLGSKTASTVLAAPSGSAGSATFRALVAADIPALSAAIITSGTFASALLSGSYTGITGVGTLSAGAIPVGLLTSSATSGYVLTVSNGAITAAAPAAASVSYPLSASNGTDAAPSYSFANATNAGMLYNGSALDFAFSGTSRMTINASTIAASLPISSTAAGSLTACTYQVGAANTGLYYPASSNLGMVAGGTQVGLLTATSVSFPAATSVSFAAATTVNMGASVMSFSTYAGSITFPSGSTAIAASDDPSQSFVLANNYTRFNGPTGALTLAIGNQSTFYGVGIGVVPLTTAYNALALAGACAYKETTQPATVTAYTHVFANSTDHHLYSSSPTYGQVALTLGGKPPSKTTTSGTSTVTVALTDNGRTWVVDGTNAATTTFNLPASSSTTDQYFYITQNQATYGAVVTAAASTNIQFDTVTGSTAGSVSWNTLGAGFALFLPKSKTTWMLMYSTGATTGTFTIS